MREKIFRFEMAYFVLMMSISLFLILLHSVNFSLSSFKIPLGDSRFVHIPNETIVQIGQNRGPMYVFFDYAGNSYRASCHISIRKYACPDYGYYTLKDMTIFEPYPNSRDVILIKGTININGKDYVFLMPETMQISISKSLIFEFYSIFIVWVFCLLYFICFMIQFCFLKAKQT